ncbi:MAG: hypothetical protein ACREOF_16375 [Gemmatimonadales bacterium]
MASARPRPSLFDIIFIIWALAVPIGFGDRLLSSDGDLARHLRLGETMLARGALLRTDDFSHTAAGQPFLAFEWGSEILYALAARAGGLAGVAVLAGLVLALTFALLGRFLVRRGCDPFLAYLTAMAAAVLSAAHWLARPHLFTLLLVVVLLQLLIPEDERPAPLGVFLLLFVVWANIHGGFSYGFILIGAFLAGELLEAWRGPDRRARLARARHLGAALLVALLGSLANPYGVALLAHVGGFFGRDAILRQTQEFMSPDFQTINGKLFLAAMLATFTALILSRRRPPWAWLFVVLGNVAMALISQRNIELFALTAMPLAALHVTPEWKRLAVIRRPREVFEREHRGVYGGVAACMVAVVLIAVALVRGRVAGVELVPDRFSETAFPVALVERARAEGLTGPIFNQFTWGGYLLYAWPEQRVFIDGGTDHYGEALFKEYIQVWNLDPGWREVLAKWKTDWVLVDPRSRLATELAREPTWGVWGCDSIGVLLRRGPADSAASAGAVLTACVPPRKQPRGSA